MGQAKQTRLHFKNKDTSRAKTRLQLKNKEHGKQNKHGYT